MAEPQQKEKELPTPGPAAMRYFNELAPFLWREGSTTTIGPDNSIKHSFKMPMEAKQALVGAREQTGLPSYKGLNPEDVIALMGQRQMLDKQARQEPLDMAQMRYQDSISRTNDLQPQMDIIKLLAGNANVEQQGANQMAVQKERDIMATGRTYISEDAAMNRVKAQVAGREKVAEIMARAQQEKKVPSLLDLQDSFNTFQFDKKGAYVPPEPSDMKVLDKFYQQHGWDILEIPLGEYSPWFSGNQPPQNVYFAVPQGGKPSETEIMQKLTKMGYKGLVPADLKKLVR